MAVLARDSVTLATITDVSNMRRYYLLQDATLTPPGTPGTNPPAGDWSTTEPTYTMGSTDILYTVDLVVFSDGTFDYLPVQVSSSYEAAKIAYNKAVAAGNQATQAFNSANARNSIIRSLTAPTPTIYHPDTDFELVTGDLWWKMSDLSANGVVIGQWVWQGGGTNEWVPTNIGHQVVASVDVNSLLVTGTARMNLAAVSQIIGDAGFYKLFAAERLVVGDTTNLWRDPESDRTYPGWTKVGNSLQRQGAGLKSGGYTTTSMLEVLPGEKLIAGWEDARSGSTATGTVTMYAQRRNAATQEWTEWVALVSSSAAGTAIETDASEVPAGTDAVRFGLFVESNMPTTTTVTLSNIWVRKQTGAVLIEDGSITANKLVVEDLNAAGFVKVGGVTRITNNELDAEVTDTIAGQIEATKTELAGDIATAAGDIASLQTTVANRTTEVDEAIAALTTNVSNTDTQFQEYKTEMGQYIVLDGSGITVGQQDSLFKVKITNTRMSFVQAGVEVAYVSNNRLFIEDAELLTSMAIGAFEFKPSPASGNLSFRYRG